MMIKWRDLYQVIANDLFIDSRRRQSQPNNDDEQDDERDLFNLAFV